MMAYQEWIKFGRDPVYPQDFYALTRKEARAIFERFAELIPERMHQLERLVNERRPRARWRPDFSDQAFETLISVVHESVERVPRPESEIEAIRAARSEILNVIEEPVWKWSVSDRTISIAFDAAIYFGNDLISKEGRMIWRLEQRQNGDLHQPILRAPNLTRKPPFLSCAPLNMFRLEVFYLANNDPHPFTMVETRKRWIDVNIAGYKQNNPE